MEMILFKTARECQSVNIKDMMRVYRLKSSCVEFRCSGNFGYKTKKGVEEAVVRRLGPINEKLVHNDDYIANNIAFWWDIQCDGNTGNSYTMTCGILLDHIKFNDLPDDLVLSPGRANVEMVNITPSK